jgi:hypothetical protein
MARDDNIGAGTSGRQTDIGGSRSGGKAGNEPHKAFGPGTPEGDSPLTEDVPLVVDL